MVTEASLPFRSLTVKMSVCPYDILWRVFHILTEAVLYTFVSVNRRNNVAQAHIMDIRIILQYTYWAKQSIHCVWNKHTVIQSKNPANINQSINLRLLKAWQNASQQNIVNRSRDIRQRCSIIPEFVRFRSRVFGRIISSPLTAQCEVGYTKTRLLLN